MTLLRLVIILFLFTGLLACRTGQEEKTLKGDEYFPVKLGDIRYYEADTIVFDYFTKSIDTISHTIREEVAEWYIDNMLDTVYRIELSVFRDAQFDWIPFKSILRKKKDNYAMESINNRLEVKMLFPIASYKTKGTSYVWNVNMFNSNEPVMLKFTSVFTSFNNGINPYNDCVSVKMNKPRTGIVNDVREEVYAKHIGLVYRFVDSTDFLLGDTSFPSGKQYFIRLKN